MGQTKPYVRPNHREVMRPVLLKVIIAHPENDRFLPGIIDYTRKYMAGPVTIGKQGCANFGVHNEWIVFCVSFSSKNPRQFVPWKPFIHVPGR